MSITYQQAKRIRKTGMMGLFADQLMYEKSVTKAIGKTISLKTRGTMMGLTQYLDPLNIAKMMTLGSSLGPALLGHWMKRDPRDVQYFTGRLKPIREGRQRTGERLTKLGRVPEGQNMDGVSDVLRKMYNLLSTTHQENIKRLELIKNVEEENKIEDERRHKELLKVLQGGKIKISTKRKPKKENSLFDDLRNFLNNFDFTKILEKIFGGARMLGSLLRFLGSRFFSFVLMNPAVLMVGTILGLAQLLAMAVKYVPNFKEQITPQQALEILSDPNLSEKDINSVGGEAYLIDKVEKLPERAEKILASGDLEEIAKAGGADFLFKVVQQKGLKAPPPRERATIERVPPRPDTTGNKNMQRAEKWDREYGGKFDPVTGLKIDGSFDRAEMAKLQRQNDLKMPTPVDTASNVGSELQETQKEITINRINKGVLQRQPSTTNNTTVNQQSNKQVPTKNEIPSVRNHEESFYRMIFESTRVV